MTRSAKHGVLRTIASRTEGVRSSLVFIPALYVVASVGIAIGFLTLDVAVIGDHVHLPGPFAATVESARTLLSTVAGATITVAGIAFSITLLLLQLASNQFSPRVLPTFFRDPTTKHVMGFSAGTFAYCLVVLRTVRRASEANATPIVPNISTFVALILGIVAIVTILAFINSSAHAMQAAEIVRRITEEAREQIAILAPDQAREGRMAAVEGALPDGPASMVRARGEGWVQWIDEDRILAALPPSGVARLETGAGSYVMEGVELCTVRPASEDPERLADAVRAAVHLGRTRTMQQDMALGFRRLVDIALRALSPGVNDPTTAVEAIVHIGSLLRDLMLRDLPARVIADDRGARVFRPRDYSYRDYVELSFAEIRHAARDQLLVARSTIQVMDTVIEQLVDAGLDERAHLIRDERERVIEEVAQGDLLASDRRSISPDGAR